MNSYIIFAAASEMKRAIEVAAEESCQSASAYAIEVSAQGILANEDVVGR